jgi:large subunit ribosomal protein L9
LKVILRQDVEKVGLRGEVVDVARGYARNFLLPRRLAEPATPARVAEVERIEAQRARHEASTFDHAQEIAASLGEGELRFDVRAGPTGVLFGSVTPTDIADEIWRRHRTRVDRRKIDLAEPIKRIGRYAIAIEVFQDVTVDVKTLVVPEGGELPPEEEEPVGEAGDAETVEEPLAEEPIAPGPAEAEAAGPEPATPEPAETEAAGPEPAAPGPPEAEPAEPEPAASET